MKVHEHSRSCDAGALVLATAFLATNTFAGATAGP